MADQFGAVLADLEFGLVGFREWGLDQRRIVVYEYVDLRHGDDGVAERAGHVFVDHGDDGLRRLYGGEGGVDRGAERYVTVLVGLRYLDHGHVARHGAAAVQALCLAQEDGDVVGVAALRDLSHIAADEERVELEHALELGIGIGGRTLGVKVVDVYIVQLVVLATGAHRLDETLRGRRYRTEVYVISRFDDLDGLFRRNEFDLRIHFEFSL